LASHQIIVQVCLFLFAAMAIFGGSIQCYLGQPDPTPRLDNVHRFMAVVYLSTGQRNIVLSGKPHLTIALGPDGDLLGSPIKLGLKADLLQRGLFLRNEANLGRLRVLLPAR
jgi:hypothetical protein